MLKDKSIGLALLIFDLTKGPVIPYFVNLENGFCEKIALRILFSGITGEEYKNKQYYGASINPFLEEKKLVFSYQFPIKGTTNSQINSKAGVIAITFPEDSQKMLYSIASDLSNNLNIFSKNLQQELETSSNISEVLKIELNNFCKPEFLSGLKTLDTEILKKSMPEINLPKISSSNKNRVEDDYDIPEITPSAVALFSKSSEFYNELMNTFGNKFFDIMSTINGNKTISEVSQILKLDTPSVIEVINILVEKGFVKIHSDPVKYSIFFEHFYNSVCRNIKKNLGDLGIKIIKKSFNDLKSPIRFFIQYQGNSNSFSFEKLKTALEPNQNIDELFSSLSKPLEIIFSELERINGKDFVSRFKTKRYEEIEKNYGLKTVNKLQNFIV